MHELTVADWRDLYEGMTQEDDGFRKKLSETAPDVLVENILSELDLAKNRFTYAMMGIHPIYWREIELSGFVDYPERCMRLYADKGERVISFQELDPSYVAFLENQKRLSKVRDVQPLSSVALHATELLYPEMEKYIEPIPMNTDGTKEKPSSKMLLMAWDRSVILMNHIHEELLASGAAKAFSISKDDLRTYCTSNIGSSQFDFSVAELSGIGLEAAGMDGLTKQA